MHVRENDLYNIRSVFERYNLVFAGELVSLFDDDNTMDDIKLDRALVSCSNVILGIRIKFSHLQHVFILFVVKPFL